MQLDVSCVSTEKFVYLTKEDSQESVSVKGGRGLKPSLNLTLEGRIAPLFCFFTEDYNDLSRYGDVKDSLEAHMDHHCT